MEKNLLVEKKYEFNLVRNAVKVFEKESKPIFGICAGLQEINVIYGGTLYQQIPNHCFKDGIIEGIEKDNIIAVQWHPEVLKDMTLFKGIVEKLFKNN